jgi:DNA-binding response OmpR family regulator
LPRQLRAQGNAPLLLVIAPRGPDWTVCLDAGADDYVPSQYVQQILRARVRALLGRNDGEGKAPSPPQALLDATQGLLPDCLRCKHHYLNFGDLLLEVITGTALRGTQSIKLAKFRARLLQCLMEKPGQTCSRKYLLKEALGYENDPGTGVLKVHMNGLRADVGTGSGTPVIETVHGEGYRLVAEGNGSNG